MIMTHGLLQKQTKNFSKHVFLLVLEDKTEISESHKQTATEGGYNKGLAEHIKVDDTAFGDVSDF